MRRSALLTLAAGLLVSAALLQLGCQPVPEGYEKLSQLVSMPDGTQIALDAFVPTVCDTEPCEPPFPVVFQYSPYHRSSGDPVTGLFTGEVNDSADSGYVQLLLSNGYAFVNADMRGSGASSGWSMDFMPAIADDGKEIVDWIAAQPWCDGNVGMFGGSYLAWAQLAVASRAPEALKCIMPNKIAFEGFSGDTYPGGIFSYALVQLWTAGMYVGNRNFYAPGGLLPTVPALDEDGDGSFLDEIPLDLNMTGTFIDDYPWPVDPADPPRYLDGRKRTIHAYFNATMEHVAHPDGAPGDYDGYDFIKDSYFINSPLPEGLTTYDLCANLIPGIMQSGVAVYDVGGWFDGFCRGTFKLYATMKDTNPSKMLVDPSYHVPLPQGFADYLGVDLQDLSETANTEMLRWYDRWLKGVDNGIDTEAPVRIYVMNGEGWRYENEWPLARQQIHSLYFEADGALAAERLNEGTDAYTADYGHSSGWGDIDASFLGMLGRPSVTDTFVRNRTTGISGYAPVETPVRTAMDEKCLTYTSEPLGSDVEVTGHPIVRLWVSSTAADGDLFFYLEDVDASGEAVLVTEAPLRLGFVGLVDNDRQINPNPGVDVLPDLPWHGYEDTDFVPGILAEGNVVEVVNDLHPTSWVFREGHRVRVSIACSDWPTFRLNPGLYAGEGEPTNLPADYVVPTITVYRDADRPSRIELPVIPSGTEGAAAAFD